MKILHIMYLDKKINITMLATLIVSVMAFLTFTSCSSDEENHLIVDGAYIYLTPEYTLEFTPEGGTETIQVETNQESWNVTSDSDWCIVDPSSSSFTVTCIPNTSIKALDPATVTVTAGPVGNTVTEKVTVKQYGLEEAYIIVTPPTPVNFPYSGGRREISVKTNQDLVEFLSDQDWCEAIPTEDGFAIIAKEHSGSEAQPAAKVSAIAGPEYNQAIAIIEVSQDGKPDIIGTNLSANGTANCYVVSASGEYYFDAKIMGNNAVTGSITPSPLTPVSVELLWQDFYDSSAKEGLIKSVSLHSSGYVQFTTGSVFNAGNAVIAVKDSEDEIIWSWHIWFVDDLQDQLLKDVLNGDAPLYSVQDRNLGACSPEPGNDKSLGLFYQWGRKDPFIGAPGKGNSSRTTESSAFLGTDVTTQSGTAFTYDINGVILNSEENMKWLHIKGETDIETSIAYPMVFFGSENISIKDWLLESNSDLWGNPWEGDVIYESISSKAVNSGIGSKSIYDPCPVGYRVMPMDLVYRIGMIKTSPNITFDTENYGIKMDVVIGTGSFWLPFNGTRSYISGKLAAVGSSLTMWTSSPAGGDITTVDHKRGNSFTASSTSISLGLSGNRSNANPVRCSKE